MTVVNSRHLTAIVTGYIAIIAVYSKRSGPYLVDRQFTFARALGGGGQADRGQTVADDSLE